MKELLLLGLLVVLLTGLGFFIGRETVPQKTLVLKPYTGLGSGVLAPGTVLKEQYKDPSSIVGKVEGGVWILEEAE